MLGRQYVKFSACFVVAATSALAATLRELNPKFPQACHRFKTLSGLPVCRYALGGAARSSQPASLPLAYNDWLNTNDAATETGAPFFFYYNPHRYPLFMSGVEDLCGDNGCRNDIFVASGGADRNQKAMQQRLEDAVARCGGKYLDMFILEEFV